MNDIKSVSFFMEECRKNGISCFRTNLNESYLKFSVNKEGAVRLEWLPLKVFKRIAVQ
jgi:DNA polymerase-3 subunit alpha